MRTLIIALFSLALVVGCSDDDTNNTKKDSGTTQKDTGTTQKDTGTTQKDVGGTGTGVTLTGSFLIFGTKTVVDGVKVCVKDSTTLCTTSDAKGAFTLKNVPDADALISMSKTGFFPFFGMYGKGQTDLAYTETSLLTPTLIKTLLTVLGTATKAGKGHLILSAGAGAAGVSFTLDKTSGEGPFYLSALGLPDKTLKETSVAGRAFVVNMDEGDYVATFKNSKGKTCTIKQGWMGASADKLKVKVIKDAATFGVLTCK